MITLAYTQRSTLNTEGRLLRKSLQLYEFLFGSAIYFDNDV